MSLKRPSTRPALRDNLKLRNARKRCVNLTDCQRSSLVLSFDFKGLTYSVAIYATPIQSDPPKSWVVSQCRITPPLGAPLLARRSAPGAGYPTAKTYCPISMAAPLSPDDTATSPAPSYWIRVGSKPSARRVHNWCVGSPPPDPGRTTGGALASKVSRSTFLNMHCWCQVLCALPGKSASIGSPVTYLPALAHCSVPTSWSRSPTNVHQRDHQQSDPGQEWDAVD